MAVAPAANVTTVATRATRATRAANAADATDATGENGGRKKRRRIRGIGGAPYADGYRSPDRVHEERSGAEAAGTRETLAVTQRGEEATEGTESDESAEPAAAGWEAWAEQLAGWAIPDDILRAAPEPPWGFPPELFASRAARTERAPATNPSQARALEALTPALGRPGGGAAATVLDVGAGGGAASLPLVPPAARIVAVDESPGLLAAFAELAVDRGIAFDVVEGTWPDVAPRCPTATVVVCHHVFYNVADLAPFIRALDAHAERRVVVELTERHPLTDLSPLWRALHGIERPAGPTAAEALRLVRSLGYDARAESFVQPASWHEDDRAVRVAFARRRLCVGPERDAEIDRLLPVHEEADRRLVTIWWDRRRPESSG